MQDLQWIEFATTGGFLVLSWYLLVRHIPLIEERHRTERDQHQAERREWLEYIQRRDDNFERLTREHIESLAQIRNDINQLRTSIQAGGQD